MSISVYQSKVSQLERQLAQLRQKDAQEAKKEADYTAKANRATIAIGRARTPSAMQSKVRELENAQKNLARATAERATISNRIASKNAELMRAKSALSSAEEKQRLKIAKEIERQQAIQSRRQKEMEKKILADVGKENSFIRNITPKASEHFDVFISHASEDKDEFVRELAEKAESAGLKVFYDENTLQWGDSLRERIEYGLANSRLAIVVLSEAFFRK